MSLVEALARDQLGEPKCETCSKKERCLIYAMRHLVDIKASWIDSPGCGQYEPVKEAIRQGRMKG